MLLRGSFIDVTTLLDVALWFSHFRFHMRRDIFTLEEFAARGAQWDEDDPAPEFDIAWYEPAWSATAPAWGYLFVVAPHLPQAGETQLHGEYIDLAAFPSPRMQAQHAGLMYIDLERNDQATRTLAVFKFTMPLAGAPVEVLDPTVERLFPGPDKDPLYGRILWNTPFWPDAERPEVQVRRLRIPEYHSAPAARPGVEDWADWLPFRGLDAYARHGFVFPRLAKGPSGRCEIAGRAFLLSDALPIVPSVPTMMIEVPIPEPSARLDILGRREVFMEYDPLSRSLSPRAAANQMTAQVDRAVGEKRGSFVPLPGVCGAWVIQVGDLCWCRVYTQREEDGRLDSTAGRAFGFDPQFGWIVKEGRDTSTTSEAIGMRAERAALYMLLGIAEELKAGAWRVTATPGTPYHRLRMAR